MRTASTTRLKILSADISEILSRRHALLLQEGSVEGGNGIESGQSCNILNRRLVLRHLLNDDAGFFYTPTVDIFIKRDLELIIEEF